MKKMVMIESIEEIKKMGMHLIENEKSKNTIEKYLRDIKEFYRWVIFDELGNEEKRYYESELSKIIYENLRNDEDLMDDENLCNEEKLRDNENLRSDGNYDVDIVENRISEFKVVNEGIDAKNVKGKINDARKCENFIEFLTREKVIDYKKYLKEKHNSKIALINSKISSLNAFFNFIKREDLLLQIVKYQKSLFSDKNREITKYEFNKLVEVAYKNIYNEDVKIKSMKYEIVKTESMKGKSVKSEEIKNANKNDGNREKIIKIKKEKNCVDNKKIHINRYEKIYYLMQTIVSTGVRVSEVKFITVEAIKTGKVVVDNKGKVRTVWIPRKLCLLLKDYCKKYNIETGSVFIGRKGKPLHRSYIWAELKNLCEMAGVDKNKIFPHNLRHLFAKEFYKNTKDIVKLATILGHSSIETTKIYIKVNEDEVIEAIEKLEFIRSEVLEE